jgi:hypothetical protein
LWVLEELLVQMDQQQLSLGISLRAGLAMLPVVPGRTLDHPPRMGLAALVAHLALLDLQEVVDSREEH